MEEVLSRVTLEALGGGVGCDRNGTSGSMGLEEEIRMLSSVKLAVEEFELCPNCRDH